MAKLTQAASAPPTIRAYLAPARHWALPLRHDFIQDPQALLDRGLCGQSDDELVAVRFILEPARRRAVREALAVAQGLTAGQPPSERRLGRMILRQTHDALREMLTFGLTGQSYEPRPHGATRELLMQARMAEAKAQSPLLEMQIQIRLQAWTKDCVRSRYGRLLACFEQYRSAFNHLRPRRPWRRREFDRRFADERSWPGASFVVSAAEAHALTGRPLHELDMPSGRQVRTRRSERYGAAPHDGGLRLSAGRHE